MKKALLVALLLIVGPLAAQETVSPEELRIRKQEDGIRQQMRDLGNSPVPQNAKMHVLLEQLIKLKQIPGRPQEKRP